MSMRKMGIMKPAAVTKKFFLLQRMVFVASLIVTLSLAFSTIPSPPILDATPGLSRRSLSPECSSSRHCYRVQNQVDVKGKGDSSSSSRSIVVPAVVLPLLLSFMISVSPAHASDSSSATVAAKVFNNVYADPLHPLCERKIEVARDGTTFHYSGTAVGRLDKDDDTGVLRGCSQAEIKQYTLRQGAFDGLILDGGKRISAGDGIHEGVWEAKNTADTNLGYADVDGIRWNDGNKWIVQSQSMVKKNSDGKNEVIKKPMSTVIGEFVIFSYITFSGLAGVKGIVDAYKRKQQEQQ